MGGGDIITNPPYSKAQEFVEQALKMIDEGRKVAMFLCRELTSETVEEVGKVFKRDYTSVIAAIQSLKKMMEDDEALAGRVRDIRYMLES
jgi:chromosomal replication initiation ATPase DnaA